MRATSCLPATHAWRRPAVSVSPALPTIRIDYLSESEKRAYKVADNRIAELAELDLPELSIELTELIDIDFNMDALGFDAPTIDLVLIEAARQADAEPDAGDAIPDERPGPAVSRTGDIWSLGLHRVICGSALDPEVLKALMGERQARLVLTDAPYNVPVRGFVSGLGKVKHREFAMASGEMSKPEFLAFLTEVSVLSAGDPLDGGLHYGFMDWAWSGHLHGGYLMPAVSASSISASGTRGRAAWAASIAPSTNSA